MAKQARKAAKARPKSRQANFRLPTPLLDALDNLWNNGGFGESADRTEVFRKLLGRLLEEEQRFLVRTGYGIDRQNNLVFFHNGQFAVAELKYAPVFYDSIVEAMASIGKSGEIADFNRL